MNKTPKELKKYNNNNNDERTAFEKDRIHKEAAKNKGNDRKKLGMEDCAFNLKETTQDLCTNI